MNSFYRVNELRHLFRKNKLTSAHVIILHDAEVNIRCRSPQVDIEVTSVPKLLVPEHRLPHFNKPNFVSELGTLGVGDLQVRLELAKLNGTCKTSWLQ